MRNRVAQRRARLLRNATTDAERHLWRQLRLRQLGGYRFRRQVPIGEYIVDFACLQASLVVELDGGHHQDQCLYDHRRDRTIESAGFRVLRFWDDDVLKQTEAVLNVIAAALETAGPHPNLPPQAGEGDNKK